MANLRIGSTQTIKRGIYKGKEVKIAGRLEENGRMFYLVIGNEMNTTRLETVKSSFANITIGKVYRLFERVSVISGDDFKDSLDFTEKEKSLIGTVQEIKENDVSIIPAGTKVKVIGISSVRSFLGDPLYIIEWAGGYMQKNFNGHIYECLEVDKQTRIWTVYGKYLGGYENE